ncbi:MAG: Methionine aminopeptidase 1 [Calditrichaeota bacterium]|nr:Methionine aminopeptidase 1 [Calditrichota bacterium]
MIRVKSPAQIEEVARAGALVAECHAIARAMVKPGATTAAINEAVERHIAGAGATAAFKGYPSPSGADPFPAACCMSVDAQVVHGFPNRTPLRAGQILSIDIGVRMPSGWYGDAARTVAVGSVSDEARRLIEATRESLDAAIAVVRPGAYLSDIGHAVQTYVEERGFSVVRDLVGHGIGREMHEPPEVPNFGAGGRGLRLRKGMTLCIEPMINMGDWRVKVLADGWTVVTGDGKPSAHFEHMIAVLDGGACVLSPDPDEEG